MFRNAIARSLLLGCFVLTLLVSPALAEYVFEATMTGDQVVPASDSTGYGMATLIMNDAMTEIAYTVNFAGLDAAQTAAGFFSGTPDMVGTEVMTLPVGSPLSGMWMVTPEIADALMNDGLYISIFSDSAMFPDGELRGNFSMVIVSDEAASLDQIKALYR